MSETLEDFSWKFQSKDRKTGKLRKYVIKRVPEDRFEDVKDFFAQYFIRDEAMNECRKTIFNTAAVEAGKVRWEKHLKKNCSLICFDEDSNEIVGFNLMTIHTKQEEEDDKKKELQDLHSQPKCEVFADIYSVVKLIYSQFDVFEHYKVDKYLGCNGMATHADHRRNGIATEFFKARIPLMKILGLNLTTAGCTGIGSQTAAERAGYDKNYSLRYDELHKYQKGLYFHGIKHEHIQIFSLKI